MKLLSDVKKAVGLATQVLNRRRAYLSFRKRRSADSALSTTRYDIAVYFSDSHVNAYQVRQWYEPLQKLNEHWPVVVIARNIEGAELLARESGLPVVFAPGVEHLERLVAKHPLKIVMYVNQNTTNFQMLRYGRRWHVFINHGESDKVYMTTNQIKAYDFAFIAGRAARERLTKHVWNYEVSQRTFEVGRPQADFMTGEAPYPSDDRITVLYAPTWEGDRPNAFYGSVLSHGEKIATAILASPQHRLVYRPHPRTGVEHGAYRAAHNRIVRAIAHANAVDPGAHHVFDESPSITWQLSQTDVAVCDISAMIYDRLAVGKPVLVTRPAEPQAVIDDLGYLQACEWLGSSEAHDVIPRIHELLHDESSRETFASWSEHYFGDTSPGAPMRRFTGAVEELMARWEDADEEMGERLQGDR